MIENRGRAGDGYRYRAQLSEVGNPVSGVPPLERVVEVSGHDPSQSVWDLILCVLSRAHAGQGAETQDPEIPGNDKDMLGLFLDILPAAWGLMECQLEDLLDLPTGWLRAWRNHEVEIDDRLKLDILELGALQRGIRALRTPEGYSGFWWHRWAAHSPIGARTPWQAFVEDGPEALAAIRRHLDSGQL
jgi:hypothetical protein